MKKYLLKFVVFLTFFSLCVFFSASKTHAQTVLPQAKSSINVSAKVGQFSLNLYGWISPYASIVLTSEGIFMSSTTADSKGNFSFSQIAIKEGFSSFCLEAIDFKRLGSSYTCFNISPAKADVTMKDIFLPPTLGLARNEIGENEDTTAFGYTMPGAKVKLHLSNGQLLETTADGGGYYQFRVGRLKPGNYQLYATAEYNQVESLKPTKVLGLKSLSWWQLLLKYLKELWDKIVKFITATDLGILWIGFPLLFLIIFLIIKLWPGKFSFIYNSKLLAWIPRRKKKKLHHDWFMGY